MRLLKINRISMWLVVFTCLLSLSSCFDIIEEINVKQDGSGSMTLTVNLSKSKTKLASIMLLDSINGHKVPQKQDIETALNQAVEYLQQASGISNIQKKTDFNNFIFSLSCDFKQVKDIDMVIREVTKELKVKPFTTSFSFDNSSKTFQRENTFSTSAKREYTDLQSDDQQIFDDSFYTCIYRFEKEVNHYSNANAKLSKSKKAVMLRASALDVINGKTSLSNKITLSK
ncbi:hypothetical protein LVD15_17890 [Fulvivirga maritima]|uniref:hypothetical protein n=1 Tax=Fulvivirga maritima TaxID=2904247 RepID=UPI001F4033DB|nr:hypothetical protein [Fulvivirga maritima]UII25168.1 hypothetical protein LVD15_17890 [Fulvivirga maritima]